MDNKSQSSRNQDKESTAPSHGELDQFQPE